MERPILFNTDMVKAILEGRKTQTRRIIDKGITNCFDVDVDGIAISYIDQETGDKYPPKAACKYDIGDTLWVRETWQKGFKESAPCDINSWSKLNACVPCHRSNECSLMQTHPYEYLFKASPDTCGDYGDENGNITWRPSIHMPRAAARIFLKVTDMRVERLWDITEEDANCEGFINNIEQSAKEVFFNTWERIYSNWGQNPWVWVIEFERMV